MEIKRNGSRSSDIGPANYFIGKSEMSHISIVEKLDGKSANWMEQVREEQYKEEN